ncbi:MerR family transcriptional regulator [Elusimicrobiota bacterium]
MAGLTKALTDPVITIGTMAERTSLSVSAIRKYEAEGLLIPHRTPSGYRYFSYEDFERVKIIRHMIQDLGLNMEGIRRLHALLPCWELAGCSSSKRKRCPAYHRDNSKPCWISQGGNCSPTANECRHCVVYRFGSQCTEDIKRLVYTRSGQKDLNREVRKILNDKRKQ